MTINRREFLQVLAAATASGMPLSRALAGAATPDDVVARLYDPPRFGNVHFLHFTDCHAQLMPVYFREPSVNIGIGGARGHPPHLVGEAWLKHFGIVAGERESHAFTHLDFAEAARRFGKLGGFAHLATLVKRLRASRPGALLLDGGDTWQGSGLSLWTQGQDMVDACKLLGVEVMTGHWEYTLGADRVKAIVDNDFKGRIDFVAQNVSTLDFNDPVFPAYSKREMNGVPVAVIGQSFPYTPIANPRWQVPDWTFGIQEENLQKIIDQARGDGARVVVLLSHNGMDVDLKLASRVRGLDAILGGHTHDGIPRPIVVANAGGKTLVTNAGSNGKFLGVLDFDVHDHQVRDFRYRLLPVFSDLLPADREMAALIERARAPYAATLSEPLAVSEGLLYRRGNFNGSFDQLILDAMIQVGDVEIALSPGFRWGTTVLPGQVITREHLMDQTAITYPWTTLTEMTGETIKTILEDVCDNLFNPDPYYQQGGDMVRVGGMRYTCVPNERMGRRIQNMTLKGKPIDASRRYKVAGWAPVSEEARRAALDSKAQPIWTVVETYLKDQKTIRQPVLNQPILTGVEGNPGIDNT